VSSYAVRAGLGDGQADLAREQPDGVGKPDLLLHLDELDHVAADAAAEAVKEPLLAVDVKGRRLLTVERAQALVAVAGLLQGHVFLDHLHDIRAGAQVVDERRREQAH
jgi:hypothetical protein